MTCPVAIRTIAECIGTKLVVWADKRKNICKDAMDASRKRRVINRHKHGVYLHLYLSLAQLANRRSEGLHYTTRVTETSLRECMSSITANMPSASSRAFRANLARLVSPLRRVRPRAPFFELVTHRTPTIALYRNLLRYAPDDNIRARVQYLFRKHQHATGTGKTRAQLLKGYKYLEAFKKASEGDEKQRVVLARYSRLIAAKVEKEHWKRLVRAEVAWQVRLRSRPILTGALIKPTLYNPPLPRMKPQPPAISRIIFARMRARERRIARNQQLAEDLVDLRHEAAFEDSIARFATSASFERVYSGDAESEWLRPLHAARAELEMLARRDIARSQLPVSPALLETLRAARREKVANKTRERLRERRGEILRCTIERARKGPPAHVLARMTPAERHADRIVRGVGEVGYVGMVKRRMGVKLRDGGKGLARENGKDLDGERLERLKKMELDYWKEKNRRRRLNMDIIPES
ncbi:hypothetical protein MSAN_00019000 [Mycena sanguinolenta]|uniref:Uncharacterized protein n=1 Tax=Mycena sanguinolenta TaxID=230812 RepID=A0A8H6ZEP8_9AGAR|nr:hypothetical protein MSAN_00019000 [Mycena sanguinolenta]